LRIKRRPLLLWRRIEEIWVQLVSFRGDREDRGDSGNTAHVEVYKSTPRFS
jgi:hypothetical protein